MIDGFKSTYSSNAMKLSFRILDELLHKEQITSKLKEFSKLLSKDMFLKSVFVCAIETVFFIQQ